MSSPLLLSSNLVSEFNQKGAGIGVLEIKFLDFQPPAIQERSWEARNGVEKHKPYKIIIWEWGWGKYIVHLGKEKRHATIVNESESKIEFDEYGTIACQF